MTQSEITLTNENVTMMIIYFGLCQLPSVAPQLLNIPLLRNSRFHLPSPICSMYVVPSIWQLSSSACCLLPAEAQLKVSNVLAIVLDSSRCRKWKPECPYRADIILGKTWFKRFAKKPNIYTNWVRNMAISGKQDKRIIVLERNTLQQLFLKNKT